MIRDGSVSGRYTRPIITISQVAIALSVMVMIAAICIVSGFQEKIKEKVVGFGSHIQIRHFESKNAYETRPISTTVDFYPSIDTLPEIDHIQVFALKAGIFKSGEMIQGTILKGVDSLFDWNFFKQNLITGETLQLSDEKKSNGIVISKHTAQMLDVDLDESIYVHFIQDPPRVRKFKVEGIYETGFTQFDELYAIVDIRHIQKLNNWNDHLVSGFELLINDFDKLEDINYFVYNSIDQELYSSTIAEANPDIFNWLELQDINVQIIITLMLLVAAINVISALLILILERVSMIGLLKALGSFDWSVRKIFIYNGIYLMLKGLFWGNLIAILLCYLQLEFGIIKLPQESYYISEVPILFNWVQIFLLNLFTVIITFLVLIIPSFIISRITPAKTMRYQ